MRIGLPLLILFGATCSLPAQQERQSAFRITGLVLNARDNSAVRHGHVTVSLVAAGRGGIREPLRTDTDDAGRFLVELPSSGNWQVNVSAHNIRSQNFEEHEGYFSGVILTAAVPTYDLVFHAVPDAVLSGTVTDEAGETVRNAQVLLFEANDRARLTGGQPLQQKQGTQTDDRGHYEFASLADGRYVVQVQARPWYVGNVIAPRFATAAPSPDPSLDVVYPITWYPGATDVSGAETLIAHPSDRLQADIRLQPEPSAHLVLPGTGQPTSIPGHLGPNGDNPEQPQPFRGNPNISLILPNGTTQPVFGQFSRNTRGDVEIGGLASGTYQVTIPGSPDSAPRTTTVQLRAGAAPTEVALSQQTSTPVTISVDGDSKMRASEIVLRSTLTGQLFPELNPQEMRNRMMRSPSDTPAEMQRGRPTAPQRSSQPGTQGRPGGQSFGPGSRARGRSPSEGEEATVLVPPGQYEVGLSGGANGFMTGTSAKGAAVVGKMVTITESPAHLTVHLGTGFAKVQGTASFDDKPSVGALVLLVPATMGDPASLTVVHRDQTNTDGSFRMEHIVPGAYILVAIDHGWSVRWTDPDTLRPYLLRGVPLDLSSSGEANQELIAIAR